MSKNKNPDKITTNQAAEMFGVGWYRANAVLSSAKSRERVGKMLCYDKPEAIALFQTAQAEQTVQPEGTVTIKQMPARYGKTSKFFTDLFKSKGAPKPSGVFVSKNMRRTNYYDTKTFDRFMKSKTCQALNIKKKGHMARVALNKAFRITSHEKA